MPENDQPVAYFQLRSFVGVDADGNLEPIASMGLSLPMPSFNKEGELVLTTERIEIAVTEDELSDKLFVRAIPGTRYVETSNSHIAAGVLASQLFDQVDQPTKKQITAAEKETQAHIAAREKAAEEVAKGNEPAPDATDHPTDPETGDPVKTPEED